jgi:hypothetical protein
MAAVIVETFLAFAWAIYANGAIQPRLPTQEEYLRFREMFGTEPIVCVALWDRLDPVNQIHKDAMPFHLLWSLYYVFHYPKQRQLSSFLKVDIKTARVWIWRFLPRIAEITIDIIAWENRYDGISPLPGILAVLDGTSCPIQEPRQSFSKGWSAFKFGKKAGVTYEVCQCLATGWIVWINGPYPAGDFPDKTIFDRELILMIDEGETVLADAGYSGRDRYITSSNMYETNPVKKRAKARLEQLNSRFKGFEILKVPFREEKARHYDVFHAIAVIIQLEIEMGVYVPFPLV